MHCARLMSLALAAILILELTSLGKQPNITRTLCAGRIPACWGYHFAWTAHTVSSSRADPGSFPFPVVPPLFGPGTRIGWLGTLTLGLSWSSIGGHFCHVLRLRSQYSSRYICTRPPPRYRLSAVTHGGAYCVRLLSSRGLHLTE